MSIPENPNIGAVDVVLGTPSPEGSDDNRCKVSDTVDLDALAVPCSSFSHGIGANEMLGRQPSLPVLV